MLKSRKGHPHTEESKRKIAFPHMGKKRAPFSEEWKRNMSLGMKGKKFSPEHLKNLSIANTGKKLPEAQRKKISEAHKGKPQPNQRGDKNHNWKGGITPINTVIRKSLEYKLWRESVLQRDNYTCLFCGIKSTIGDFNLMEVDHIKSFAQFPELRFAIDNGRTLCKPCHRSLHKSYNFNH